MKQPILGCMALSLLVFAGCGANGSGDGGQSSVPPRSDTGAPPASQPQSLLGMTTREVLVAKYTKAELSCTLTVRTTETGASEATVASSQTLAWDLLTEPGSERTFELEGDAGTYHLALTVTFSNLRILDVDTVGADGTRYEMQFSPVVDAAYRGAFTWSASPELRSEGSFHVDEQTLDEALPGLVFHREEGLAAGLLYASEHRCILSTQAKSEYRDQFSVIPVVR